MGTSLRVLILEDRDSDVELVVHALSRAGYALEWRRVDSEAAFVAALADVPELILADYSLPQFTALEAVRLLRARGHDMPCIVVSGTIGEELAVECLKAGADDYLLKDRLARLGHAVSRALGEHEQRERQRAAEKELRENEARFRAIMESISDVIVVMSDDETTTYVSPSVERVLGYQPAELVGAHPSELLHPDDLAAALHSFADALKSADVSTEEFRLRHRNGSWRLIEAASRSVVPEAGERRLISTLRDITEHRHLESVGEQLRQDRAALEVVNRHRSDFLAAMSHELRTPLNAIIGFSEVMLDHDLIAIPDEQRKAFLNHIHRAGHHLLGLATDILDLSKIDAGAMELHLEQVVIRELIADCVSMMRIVADGKHITLEAACDPPGAVVTIDKARVKQIVYNLVSNAVKFTPRDGHVSLTCTIGTQELVVAVRDTGVGIKLEDQELIFDEFHQTADGSRQAEGSGLGLTLVRKLVELHGGRISVDSTPGNGSCFTLSIPRLVPAAPAESPARPAPVPPRWERQIDPAPFAYP